jgi:uncharacterized protein
MAEYKKPIPVSSIESKPYWEGLRKHRLLIQRCNACRQHWFPPSTHCPSCSSADFSWTPVSGRGKIFSYVVYHRVYHPGFANEVPYTVALVELEEGPRMISNVIGIPSDKVVCDMPVQVVYEDINEAATLPKFTPRAVERRRRIGGPHRKTNAARGTTARR